MTGQAPIISTGSQSMVQVSIDLGAVPQVFLKAPKIAHFWIHGFLFSSYRNHRVAWLKKKGTQFGRGSSDPSSKAVRVFRVNEGPDSPRDSDVVYRVSPKVQRATSPDAAIQGLKTMRGEAFAGSVALRVHEFGEDITAKRGFMAIAVKTRPKTPAKWLQANPDKKLELRPSKKHPGEGLLFEIKRRARGRRRKGEFLPGASGDDKMRLRFILTRHVEMNPTLHMYQTWDELAGDRAKLWAGAVTKMVDQLRAGDPRDF